MPPSSVPIEKPASRPKRRTAALPFSEAAAWSAIGNGWRQLHGGFQKLGVSFEWHDFESATPFDWARSFHPDSVELCLNLAGNGRIELDGENSDFAPLSAGFYRQGRAPLKAVREAGERHQFITVEFSPAFLKEHLGSEEDLHPLVRSAIQNRSTVSGLGPTNRLDTGLQQLAASLRHPPALASAQKIWYHSKALELAVAFFFHPPPEHELFCMRQKKLAQERVKRVLEILQRDLAEPPTLEEIGREAGCSHFHLSRTFSGETGLTIPQYLRQLRMEKAAELLQSGKFNVTQAALEVGYSSLSHFSSAFHETFGCCPGLYPMATTTQKASKGPEGPEGR